MTCVCASKEYSITFGDERKTNKIIKYGKSHSRFRTIYAVVHGTTLRALLLPLTRWKKGCNVLTILWIYRQRNGNVLFLYTWLDRKFTISSTHAFTAEQKGSEDDFDTAVKSFTTYFEPKKNMEYEICKFRQASQCHGDTCFRHLAFKVPICRHGSRN